MAASVVVLAAAPIAKPNCPDRCGDVKIPYPFGTRKGCYLDPFYFINCTDDNSNKTLQPIHGNVVVRSISLDGHFEFSGYPASECYKNVNSIFYRITTFDSISYTQNVFVAVGCDTIAYLNGTKNGRNFSMGCMSVCQDSNDVVNGSCLGIGCCQVEIPRGLWDFTIEARSFSGHKEVWKFNPCSNAFIVKKDAFNFSTKYLHALYTNNSSFPMVVNWGIGIETCKIARSKSDFPCRGNSKCYDDFVDYNGYRCRCNPGYVGNQTSPMVAKIPRRE
ncbi:wall-associated receptor kinase 2-like [Carya illinoinensis]|uniref:wall-associated receptor kinase 2-like n=1 Tax=Carya illinoinensis TaxID=32201 RepID=UPI001C725A5E|nr:wall-associated receptor kinase 2-like [Carya illinoinensis]